jgi:hypothetical protein
VSDALGNGRAQVNQVQGMYIEDSDILNAGDNGVDFVAVQYGHICRTKIHEANWCIYAKGAPSVQTQSIKHCSVVACL